jgi:hypothetical protein
MDTPEAGDVGAAVGRGAQGLVLVEQGHGQPVEGGHEFHQRAVRVRAGQTALEGGGEDARAQRLGEQEHVAGSGAAVQEHLLRVHQAGHRQAVLEFVVLDGVPADEQRPGLADLGQPPFHHLAEHALGHGLHRAGEDVHAQQRPAAHGVDVGERIGRGDAAEVKGVVDDGREEVHGLDERCGLVQTIHPGVVAGLAADQEIRITRQVEPAEYSAQVPRAQLGGSARGLDGPGELHGCGGHSLSSRVNNGRHDADIRGRIADISLKKNL